MQPLLNGDGSGTPGRAGATGAIAEAAERIVAEALPRLRFADHHCPCGRVLSTCDGCGGQRCLRCDPYLSDDCSG
ncbi:hypothetical protein GCM10023192_23040 [Amycolatopsis samaneae]